MFYTFSSQQERQKEGGTAFVEIQYCRLPRGSDIKTLVSVDSICNWRDDSLYIKDENLFYTEYSHIFDQGVYNNLQKGVVDIYGINYYGPQTIPAITEKLYRTKPAGYRKLAQWLEQAGKYNGFYILGL